MNQTRFVAVALLMSCGMSPNGGVDGGNTGTAGGTANAGGGSSNSSGGTAPVAGGRSGGGGVGGGNVGGGNVGGGSVGGGSSGGSTGVPDAGPFRSRVGFLERVPVVANESCDLEVDSQGRLHVVNNFQGDLDGGLFYSVRELDGGWTTERIIGPVQDQIVGTGAKLELDSTQTPHVAFLRADIPNNRLRQRLFYGTRANGGWAIEELEAPAFQVHTFFAFQLDSTATPHLAYLILNAQSPDAGTASPRHVVRYATRPASSAWRLQTVAQFSPSATFSPSLTLDSAGNAHVFYRSLALPDGGGASSGQLWHATVSGSGLSEEHVSSGSLSRSVAGTAPGDDLLFTDDFQVRRRADGGWLYLPTSTAGNSPFMRSGPNGTVWDFSASGPSSGGQVTLGRYFNGNRETTRMLLEDAGTPFINTSGWSFDSSGAPWGVVFRSFSGGSPDGVWVLRLD